MKVLLMFMVLVLSFTDRNQITGPQKRRNRRTVSGRRWEFEMSGSGSRRAVSSYGCDKSEHRLHVGQSTRTVTPSVQPVPDHTSSSSRRTAPLPGHDQLSRTQARPAAPIVFALAGSVRSAMSRVATAGGLYGSTR